MKVIIMPVRHFILNSVIGLSRPYVRLDTDIHWVHVLGDLALANNDANFQTPTHEDS